MTVAPFDLLAPGAATVLALVAARVGGLVLIAPMFSAKTIPMPLRTAMVVLLTVFVQPVAFAQQVGAPALTPAMLVGETLIGFTMGLGAALIVGAGEMAGDLLATQIGLSGEAILDPLSQRQTTALGQFMSLFTLVVLLSFDLHLAMIDALVGSFDRLPVGAALDLPHGLAALVATGSTLFVLGIRFAAPVIGAVMIVNVALAVLGRITPQMNLLSVSFPVQIAVGLAALLGALPFIANAQSSWRAGYDTMVSNSFAAFAGGAH